MNYDEEGTQYTITFMLKEQTFIPDFIKCLSYIKRTARISLDGNSSKAVYMQYVTDKSWLTAESPDQNPDLIRGQQIEFH